MWTMRNTHLEHVGEHKAAQEGVGVHVERKEPFHILLNGVRGQRLPEILVSYVAASIRHEFI
jgi:hypothetical protein